MDWAGIQAVTDRGNIESYLIFRDLRLSYLQVSVFSVVNSHRVPYVLLQVKQA